MRMTKSNSASKFSSPNQNNWSLSTSAVFRSITSEEEKEKVRRRQWLKEMLHMKRERVSLKP